MLKLATTLAIACALGSTLYAQAPSADETGPHLVSRLMNFHIALESKAPPGWSISATPVSLDRGPNNTVIAQVHIFIHGAPPDTLFEQQSAPVGDDKIEPGMAGITVGKDGILMCAGRSPDQCGDAKRPDDPIEFTSQSIPGEPLRFLFVSPAGSIGFILVTNPISGRNKGCTVSAVRLAPAFELALITGTGYPPETDVHYTTSPNGGGDHVIHTDQRGVFRFSLIPYSKGAKRGEVKVKIQTPACSPELTYSWGDVEGRH